MADIKPIELKGFTPPSDQIVSDQPKPIELNGFTPPEHEIADAPMSVPDPNKWNDARDGLPEGKQAFTPMTQADMAVDPNLNKGGTYSWGDAAKEAGSQIMDFGKAAWHGLQHIGGEIATSMVNNYSPVGSRFAPLLDVDPHLSQGTPEKQQAATQQATEMISNWEKTIPKDNDTVGAKLGGIMPYVGAGLVSMFAPEIAPAITAGFFIQGQGAGLEHADQLAKDTNEPMDPLKRQAYGLGYGVAMSVPMGEMIGQFIPSGMKSWVVGKLFESNPALLDGVASTLESYLSKTPSASQKLFSGAWDATKKTAGSMAGMEVMDLGKKGTDATLGENISLSQIVDGVKESVKGGGLFSLILTPFGMHVANRDVTARREAQGAVHIGIVDGNPADIYQNQDGSYAGLTPAGEVIKVTPEQAKTTVAVPINVFNKATKEVANNGGKLYEGADRDIHESNLAAFAKRYSREGEISVSSDANNKYLVVKSIKGDNAEVVTAKGDHITVPLEGMGEIKQVPAGQFVQDHMNAYDFHKAVSQASAREISMAQLDLHTDGEINRLQHTSGNMETVNDVKGNNWNIRSGDINDPNAPLYAVDPKNPDPNQVPTIVNRSNLNMDTHQSVPSADYKSNTMALANQQWDAKDEIDKAVKTQKDAQLNPGDQVTSKRQKGAIGTIKSMDHNMVIVEYPGENGSKPATEIFTKNQVQDITKIQPNEQPKQSTDPIESVIPGKDDSPPVEQADVPKTAATINIGSREKPEVVGIISNPDGTERLDKEYQSLDDAQKAAEALGNRPTFKSSYDVSVSEPVVIDPVSNKELTNPKDPRYRNGDVLYHISIKPKATNNNKSLESNLGSDVRYKGEKGKLVIDDMGYYIVETPDKRYEIGKDGSQTLEDSGITKAGKIITTAALQKATDEFNSSLIHDKSDEQAHADLIKQGVDPSEITGIDHIMGNGMPDSVDDILTNGISRSTPSDHLAEAQLWAEDASNKIAKAYNSDYAFSHIENLDNVKELLSHEYNKRSTSKGPLESKDASTVEDAGKKPIEEKIIKDDSKIQSNEGTKDVKDEADADIYKTIKDAGNAKDGDVKTGNPKNDISKKRIAKEQSERQKLTSRTPLSMEEDILQRLLSGDRLDRQQVFDHSGIKEGSKEARELAWKLRGKGKEGGLKLDLFHEDSSSPQFYKDNKGMDTVNQVVDVLRSHPTARDMMDRLQELQQEKEQPLPSSPEQMHADIDKQLKDAGVVKDKEDIYGHLTSDPDLKHILAGHDFHTDGKIDWNKLSAHIDSDPDHFTQFPFGLTYKQLKTLKDISNEQRTGHDENRRNDQGDMPGNGENPLPGNAGDKGEVGGKEGAEGPISPEYAARIKAEVDDLNEKYTTIKGQITAKKKEFAQRQVKQANMFGEVKPKAEQLSAFDVPLDLSKDNVQGALKDLNAQKAEIEAKLNDLVLHPENRVAEFKRQEKAKSDADKAQGKLLIPDSSNPVGDILFQSREKVGSGNLDKEIADQNPNLNPTPAQKEAGNYKKAHVNVQGMDITIENPKGSTRSGTDQDGKQWSNKIKSHYGYFKQTEGKDGDHIDTFIGPNANSEKVFVIDQINPKTGEFDESKVMLGYNSKEAARKAYLANYASGWKGIGNITESGLDTFKTWLNDGQKQHKPYADYRQIQEESGGLVANLTPYAGDKISKYNEISKKIDKALAAGDLKEADRLQTKMKDDLEARLRRILPDQEFTITMSRGLWVGGGEPSFSIDFKDANDDTLAALAKVAKDFDQDEVHIRDNRDIPEDADLLTVQPDGSFYTPAAVIEFDGTHDLDKMILDYGFGGGTIIDGNTLLLYQTYLPSETGMTAEQLHDNWDANLKRLRDDSKGIIREDKEGITRLRRYSRDVSGEGTKTYEQALSDLYPSEETRKRPEGKSTKNKVSRGDKHNSILAHTFLEK